VAVATATSRKPIDVDAFPRQVAEFLGGKREKVESRDEGVYLRELNSGSSIVCSTRSRSSSG